jgi:hypothetical protein
MICGASLALGCGGGSDDSGTAGAGGTAGMSFGGTSAGGSSPGGSGSSGSAGRSSGGTGGTGASDDGCTGAVVAEWDVDGVHYKSSASLFTDVGPAYTFNLVACRPPGSANDTIVEFSQFATPVATATYTLKDQLLSGMSGDIHGALYAVGNATYKTDADHMGTFTVTAVDTTAMTLDGTFSFTALGVDGTNTVAITNGVITKMKYSVLMQ